MVQCSEKGVDGNGRRISLASSHYHVDEPERKYVETSLEQLSTEVSKIMNEESSCPMVTRRAHEQHKIRALQKSDRKKYFGNSGRLQFYQKFHQQTTREKRRKARKRAQKLPPLEKTIELSERLAEKMDTSGTSSPSTWLDFDTRTSSIWDEFQIKNDIEGEEDQEEAFLENPDGGDREEDDDEDEDEGDDEIAAGEEEEEEELGLQNGALGSASSPMGQLAGVELRRSSSQSQMVAKKDSLSQMRSWSSQSVLQSGKGKVSRSHSFQPVKSPVARENELLSPRSAYFTFCETEVDEDGNITRYGVEPEPLVIRKAKTTAMIFRHYGVGDEVASALASSLRRMNGVTRLDFKDNMLTDRVIPKICAFVNGNDEIK